MAVVLSILSRLWVHPAQQESAANVSLPAVDFPLGQCPLVVGGSWGAGPIFLRVERLLLPVRCLSCMVLCERQQSSWELCLRDQDSREPDWVGDTCGQRCCPYGCVAAPMGGMTHHTQWGMVADPCCDVTAPMGAWLTPGGAWLTPMGRGLPHPLGMVLT